MAASYFSTNAKPLVLRLTNKIRQKSLSNTPNAMPMPLRHPRSMLCCNTEKTTPPGNEPKIIPETAPAIMASNKFPSFHALAELF